MTAIDRTKFKQIRKTFIKQQSKVTIPTNISLKTAYIIISFCIFVFGVFILNTTPKQSILETQSMKQIALLEATK